MPETSKGVAEKHEAVSEKARSLPIAKRGVSTAQDFANLMSSLMSDLIEGRIGPDIANAVCNAGGKMLKVVEMQHKYGKRGAADRNSLVLADAQD